jgi:hypothetical protein
MRIFDFAKFGKKQKIKWVFKYSFRKLHSVIFDRVISELN